MLRYAIHGKTPPKPSAPDSEFSEFLRQARGPACCRGGDFAKLVVAQLRRHYSKKSGGGATNQEIAGQMDCVVGTVERKLALIRKRWSEGQAAPRQ
jgi:hypothetical protein